MELASLSEIGAGPDRPEPTAASLGQQDFLRMLIAQLENQDPLNPQEATEFSSQLAQFSSLEQSIAMRTTLEQISTSLSGGDKGTAIGLIGRDVVAESGLFELGGGNATLQYELGKASESTLLEIRDARGSLVHSAELGARAAGSGVAQWDGTGRSGNPLPDGVYQFEVVGVSNLVPFAATPLIEGRVSGADVSSGNPVLRIGDVVIPLSNIREVRGNTTSSGEGL